MYMRVMSRVKQVRIHTAMLVGLCSLSALVLGSYEITCKMENALSAGQKLMEWACERGEDFSQVFRRMLKG